MEEFNGGVSASTTQQSTKEQLLSACLSAQGQRSQPSPGIRYRNLGKSGLRVSNVGLGKN